MSQVTLPDLEAKTDEERRALPRWKKLCVVAALLSVLFGLGLSAFAGSGEPAPTSGGNALPSGAEGFLPGGASGQGGEGAAKAEAEGLGAWSPLFVKGGFSFFVGFSIGYALRAFFKISAVAFGLLFLVLAGLSYYGVIEVDWSRLDGWYDTALSHLKGEFTGIKAVLLGSLPSAALAGVGLVTGFKRS